MDVSGDLVAAAAVIGPLATIGAAWLGFSSALSVDQRRAERKAVADLMQAAFDVDAALLKLADARRDQGVAADVQWRMLKQADAKVQRATRRLERQSYLVADGKLRSYAGVVVHEAWYARSAINSDGPLGEPLARILAARKTTAMQAGTVIEQLAGTRPARWRTLAAQGLIWPWRAARALRSRRKPPLPRPERSGGGLGGPRAPS